MEKWNQTRQPGGVGRLILRFEDWSVSAAHDALGYQLDNETRELTLLGDLPQGWTWDVLVQAQGKTDIWPLALTDEGAKFTLTDENLSIKGPYCLQVRGTKGSQVRHCNAVTVYVLRTLAGTVTWPTLPTEFAQAEKNIKELNAHPPIPGENGFWLLWDLETSAYTESQLSVPVGPAGPANTLQIGTVETLEPGQAATAQIIGEAPNQTLSLGIPQGQTGKTGATPALEIGQVETLEPGEPATAELSGTPEKPVLSLGIPQGPPGQDGVQLNDSAINTTEAWSSKKIVDTLCPSFSVSGNPVTCNPVEDYPLSAVVTLEPKQAGSGDPSPDNVRPISGYDSLSVTRCGKNLFNVFNLGIASGLVVNDEGVIHISTSQLSGGITTANTLRDIIGDLPIGPNYTLNANSTGSDKYIYLRGSGRVWRFGESLAISNEDLNNKIVFYASGTETQADISEIQLELGSTPTPYEPYQPGTTATLTLPETIYGGTVDAVTGVGSKTWGYIASYNGESLPGEWISDRDVYASGTTPTTGAQVAYKLATPEPFQATGNHPLPAVAGLNTVYTDGDSLTVTGRRDLVSALEDLQTTMTAVTTLISEGGLT